MLGICLGLQLLFESSTELGGAEGLGLLAGAVDGLDAPGLKVPHIGWAPVRWERESRLAEGIESETPFYFVHSFVVRARGLGAARQRRVRRALRLRRRARQRLRRPVPPREVERRRPPPARQLRRRLRRRPRLSARATMILYPAIDIRGGRAVRLVEGDYDRETEYDSDPVEAAIHWADEGSHYLHVVDLDGAKAGEPQNLELVRRIADTVPFPIQVGGGLRDAKCVSNVLRAGAERVVIGTAAFRDPRFLQEMLDAHGRADRGRGRCPRRHDLARRLDRDLRGAGDRGGRRADHARRHPLHLHPDRGRRHARGARACASWPRSPARPAPR